METKNGPSLQEPQLEPKGNGLLKHKVLLPVFVVLLLVIIAAVMYFMYFSKNNESAQTEQQLQTQTDPTTDWKTYSNNLYGFEFKYPSEWSLTDNTQSSPNYKDVSIRKNLSDSKYAEISFVSSKQNLAGSSKIQSQTVIDGVTWNNWEFNDGVPGEDAPHDSLGMFATKNELNYSITLYPATEKPYDNKINIDPLLNQIVSTFKFTTVGSQVIDVPNAKTYINNKYGFELTFPKELEFTDYEYAFRLQNYSSEDDKPGLGANEFFIEINSNYTLPITSILDELGNVKETKINNYKAYEGDDISARFSPLGPHVLLIVSPNEDSAVLFTIFTSSVKVKPQIDQILSTFKFTN